MSKAISLADELNFTKPEELQEWLKDKPAEWAQVIAVRAALRVLPLAGWVYQSKNLNDDDKDQLILLTYRACLISSAARKYPAEDMTTAAADAAARAADAAYAAYAADTAYAAADAAYAAARAADAAARAADAAYAAYAADAAARAAYAANMWNAISTDVNWLASRLPNSSAAELLMNTRLWPQGEPEWMSKERSNFTNLLGNLSPHHIVWINWYNNVLNGRSFFDLSPAREKELTLKIAKQENEFWERDFAKISEDISEWLAEARIWDAGDATQLDEEEQETSSVPPQNPATVQPIWVNGRLVQSTAPMHAELEDELLAAFAQALRNEITALANAAQQSNFDKRGLALLAETAELMPDAKPDAILLFQLVFREAQLSDQVDLINDQWPETLSTRYCTLLRQLRDYLDRFSERRQFNRDKLETDLEYIDFEDLDQDVSDFGNILRSDEVNVFVDVSIPNALDSIGAVVDNQQSIEMPPMMTGRSTQIVKAADQIESVNNISRELIELFGADNAAIAFEAGKAAYIQGAMDNYIDASYEVGTEDSKKLAKLANRGAMGFAAGKSIWNRLGEKYPKFFGWLKRDDG